MWTLFPVLTVSIQNKENKYAGKCFTENKEMSLPGDRAELQFKITVTGTSQWDEKKIILYVS